MILADTSIWVDHLRAGEPRLASALSAARVILSGTVRLWTRDRRLAEIAEEFGIGGASLPASAAR